MPVKAPLLLLAETWLFEYVSKTPPPADCMPTPFPWICELPTVTLELPPPLWFDRMPARPFVAMVLRIMSMVTLPEPLTALTPLPALKPIDALAIATLMAPPPAVPSTMTPSPELPSVRTRVNVTLATMPALGLTTTPLPLLKMFDFSTTILAIAALPAPGENVIPPPAKPKNVQPLILS